MCANDDAQAQPTDAQRANHANRPKCNVQHWILAGRRLPTFTSSNKEVTHWVYCRQAVRGSARLLRAGHSICCCQTKCLGCARPDHGRSSRTARLATRREWFRHRIGRCRRALHGEGSARVLLQRIQSERFRFVRQAAGGVLAASVECGSCPDDEQRFRFCIDTGIHPCRSMRCAFCRGHPMTISAPSGRSPNVSPSGTVATITWAKHRST